MKRIMHKFVLNEIGYEEGAMSPQDFNEAIAKVMEEQSCSRLEAMSLARERHPTLYDAYQSKAVELQKAAHKESEQLKVNKVARSRFHTLVMQLRNDRNLSHMDAMRNARRDYPDEFSRAYGN